MNRVILVGRFTKDAEVRQASSTMIARFTLAVDRKYRKDEEASADFINCVAFGKTAEFIERYFRKGMKAGVEGRIQTGSYTNKDGQRVYTTDVVIDGIEFVESKKDSAPAPQPDGDSFITIDEDEFEGLPFN